MARVTGWGRVKEAVHHLFSGGGFLTHKNITQPQKRRFDGRAKINILQELFESERDNSVEVKTGFAVFRRNLTNPGRLVNAVLTKVIPGGFKQTDLL
ncbi:hypothetical protein MARHY3694 [Marinobacter nauticus ATCC 49840]|nr:hypothetical protein MARHY3694 [Marinobacter nauticus ATCC 49840]